MSTEAESQDGNQKVHANNTSNLTLSSTNSISDLELDSHPSNEQSQANPLFHKLTNDTEELARTVALLLDYVSERGDRISRLEAFLHQHDSGDCFYARRCAHLETVVRDLNHKNRKPRRAREKNQKTNSIQEKGRISKRS